MHFIGLFGTATIFTIASWSEIWKFVPLPLIPDGTESLIFQNGEGETKIYNFIRSTFPNNFVRFNMQEFALYMLTMLPSIGCLHKIDVSVTGLVSSYEMLSIRSTITALWPSREYVLKWTWNRQKSLKLWGMQKSIVEAKPLFFYQHVKNFVVVSS